MPKISIIVPIYNVERYLPACLDSVLNQTFWDFEIICINDGSTDNSANIVEEYVKKDNRIKMITQENKGLSMARNNGAKQASGEYIYFLDSDDFIHPQLLEICYHLAQKENADIVAFGFYKGVSNRDTIKVPHYQLDTLKYALTNTPLYYRKKCRKYRIPVSAWSKLYKKDSIADLSFIPNITMEDYPYAYTLFAKHPKTVILTIPLYYYVSNPTSILSQKLSVKNIQDYRIGLNSVIDVYEKSSKKEKNFVLHTLFPSILKQQLDRIAHSPAEKQPELYQVFSEELKDLKQKGWLKLRGHKLSRYLQYRRLTKGDNK